MDDSKERRRGGAVRLSGLAVTLAFAGATGIAYAQPETTASANGAEAAASATEPAPGSTPTPVAPLRDGQKVVRGKTEVTVERVATDNEVPADVIASEIENAYRHDDLLGGTPLEVTVTKGGLVSVQGAVASARARDRALEIARWTRGVRTVKDARLTVQGEAAPATPSSDSR